MAKKLAIVTGGNTGLGHQVVKQLLASSQWKTVIACRDLERGNEAAARLRKEQISSPDDLEVRQCNLAELDSVRQFAQDVHSRYPKLDLLVCNAAIIPPKLSKTKDGNELAFQTCHLGHFLLTMSLMPLLQASPQSRIVVVSSELHRRLSTPTITAQDLNNLTASDAYNPMQVYSTAKLYNIWFTKHLATLLPAHIKAVAVTPGWVPTTQLGRYASWPVQLLMQHVLSWLPMTVSITEGAGRIVDACINPACESGQYWSKRAAAESTALGNDAAKAEELWKLSLALTGTTPPDWTGLLAAGGTSFTQPTAAAGQQ